MTNAPQADSARGQYHCSSCLIINGKQQLTTDKAVSQRLISAPFKFTATD